MALPPIDKSLGGLLRDHEQRLTLVERRLVPDPLPDQLGPTGGQVTDWNTALTPGFYWSISAANSPVAVDGGSGSWFAGTVLYHPGPVPRYLQEVREARTAPQAITYQRYWNGTTWTAWTPSAPFVLFHGTVANVSHTNGVFFIWGATGGAYTEVLDAYAAHSAATNPTRITVATAGLYRVSARMAWTGSVSGLRSLVVSVNGTASPGFGPQWDTVNNSGGQQTLAGPVSLAAGDYVEFSTRQTSGGALSLLNGIATVEWLNL